MASFFRKSQRDTHNEEPAQSEDSAGLAPEQGDEAAPAAHPRIGFDTVLGASSSLEGKLVHEGNLRIDGRFQGTLETNGNILIGEGAEVDADIDAQNVSIAGTVRGDVRGKRIQLLRYGRVVGDIQAEVLITEEGAQINGSVKTISGENAQQAEQQASGGE